VASSKVIGFEMGKDDEIFKPRFDSIPASYILEQVAKHVKRENKWVDKIKITEGMAPEAYVQPIAAGEKVVSSNKSVVFSYLTKYCSDAVAVDMEGNGFFVAARPHHAHAIEIRGISDLIENKADADASGSQHIAAEHAAAFAFSMIDELPTKNLTSIGNQTNGNINNVEVQKKLVVELIKLYPQGPEQDNIWKRAGGDVSFLVNTSSRKSQWFNAIEKLALGGGGKFISLESLLNTIKEDYPESDL
jgi:adenosylhomocysteine nucleosidase